MIQRILHRLRTAGRGSLELRLAYLTASGVALSTLFIGIFSYLMAQSSLYSQLDQDLVKVASYASDSISADVVGLGGVSASALGATNVNLSLLGADKSVVRVQGMAGSIQPGAQEIAIARTQLGTSTRTVTGSDEKVYRVVAVPLKADGKEYAIVLARPLDTTLATLSDIRRLVLLLGPVLVVLSAVMSYTLGRRVTSPLQQLSEAVARVSETDQLTPLSWSKNSSVHITEEINDLSRSFDTMMRSLASSRERQKRLIADAGHELRTPLTSMRTNIELLVADEKSNMLPDGTRAEILSDVAAQLGEFTSLVGDLVQLSRDDVVEPSRTPLDISDVVAASVERAKRRGPNLNYDVSLEPHFIIGEPDTLERAITNLLDNAVKFSPEHGTVHVKMSGDEIVIWDEGPGIAEEELPRIFDRFYRSNKARNTPGTGLGLSIVDHIISAHNGKVSADNHPEAGARFIVTLPAAPPETLAEFEA